MNRPVPSWPFCFPARREDGKNQFCYCIECLSRHVFELYHLWPLGLTPFFIFNVYLAAVVSISLVEIDWCCLILIGIQRWTSRPLRDAGEMDSANDASPIDFWLRAQSKKRFFNDNCPRRDYNQLSMPRNKSTHCRRKT